jgi:hypothetical protein
MGYFGWPPGSRGASVPLRGRRRLSNVCRGLLTLEGPGSKDQLISCGRASPETLQQASFGETDQGVLHCSAHQPRFRNQISHLEAAFRR